MPDPKELDIVGVVFDGVRDDNLAELKALNGVLFPIKYTDRTYSHILACGDVSQLARVEGQLIGAITGRLENTTEHIRFYIITLGVYAPYRRRGIASELVRRSLEVLIECVPEAKEACLHVHVANEEALAFYMRHGFEKVELLRDYYRQLDPPDAWLLRRDLANTAHAIENGCQGENETDHIQATDIGRANVGSNAECIFPESRAVDSDPLIHETSRNIHSSKNSEASDALSERQSGTEFVAAARSPEVVELDLNDLPSPPKLREP